jgi:hypothetical protein
MALQAAREPYQAAASTTAKTTTAAAARGTAAMANIKTQGCGGGA